MFRNIFVVVALFGLILSAAFTSWTQDTSVAGKNPPPPPSAKSFPLDTTNCSRPATPSDAAVSKSGKVSRRPDSS